MKIVFFAILLRNTCNLIRQLKINHQIDTSDFNNESTANTNGRDFLEVVIRTKTGENLLRDKTRSHLNKEHARERQI